MVDTTQTAAVVNSSADHELNSKPNDYQLDLGYNR